MSLRAGSLCTGYGGLDLAADAVLGAELAWVADNDSGAAKILAHRYPDVPNLGDITEVDWSTVEPVDVLTAGFPCQDISCAGKRAGLRKGTRSGLWYHVARAIAELRPQLVVIENVKELLSERADSDMEPCTWCLGDDGDERAMRALGAVLADLAALGFDAEWVSVPAAGVGCCHRRWRVFVLAWPAPPQFPIAIPGGTGLEIGEVQHHGPECPPSQRGDQNGLAADTEGGGWQRERQSGEESAGWPAPDGRAAAAVAPALLKTPTAQLAVNGGSQHPDKRRGGGHGPTLADQVEHQIALHRPSPRVLGATPRATDGVKGGPNQRGSSGDLMLPSAVVRLLPTPRVTARPGMQPSPATLAGTHGNDLAPVIGSLLPTPSGTEGGQTSRSGDRSAELLLGGIAQEAATAGPVIDWGQYETAIRRHEAAFGVPVPCPVEPGRNGWRLAPRFVEWMMTLPPGWVTDVPSLSRNAQLKALGNGVVPAQAAAALSLLLERAFGQAEAA